MRRALLKDLANTPTQMACGWRLYGDLSELRRLAASVVTVDLLTGNAVVQGRELAPLYIAAEVAAWLSERIEQDGVPPDTITSAELTLAPRSNARGDLFVDCATVVRTTTDHYDSRDSTRWAQGD